MKNNDIKEALKEIEVRDGYLSPSVVVNEARDESNPLHKCFDWDDSNAAEKYRIWQARQLIASIKVEWQGKKTDAYWSVTVPVESVDKKAYFSLQKVLSNEELKRQVLSDAIDNLQYWKKKYKDIKELSGIINEEKLQQIQAGL